MQTIFYFTARSLYMFRVPSGVNKPEVTVTGTSHMIVQLAHSNVSKLGLDQS